MGRYLTRTEKSPLTAREIEVLELICSGKTSKQAADILFISKRTVDFHLVTIYDALGVNNRVGAWREASRRGLISKEIAV